MTISVTLINTSKVMINLKQIRSLLKKSENKFITVSIASRMLKLGAKKTAETLAGLEVQGYIEQTNIEGYWVMSVRGKVLIYKKLDREFNVTTLRKKLKELIERAAFVNSSPQYPDYITCIKVTSEYPIEQHGTGIRITYSLARKKITEKQYDATANKLRKQYKGEFGNILEYYSYPHEAIRAYLRARSHVLKLREYRDVEIKQLNGTVIFEEHQE